MFLFFATCCGCGTQSPRGKGGDMQRAELVRRYPHDPRAFTQGLVYLKDNQLLEGTGQYGQSQLRLVEIETGKVLQNVPLDAQYFGEGIALFQNKIYQLTWKNNLCLVYDQATMQLERSFKYAFEGWGLTHNDTELILSDGSFQLRFIRPDDFQVLRTIDVVDRGTRIKNLNELEWVNGEIWANIWYEDRIARIDPRTGGVVGWLDLSHLFPKQQRDREAVMNGIAYDAATKRLFITGKNWPSLFEIKVPSLP
jgi:glutamine cyclotransferase